ncbi:phage tail tape measure protein [Paenibacillus sp. FSL M7-0547]|uniref:phage tail tape measure protein n=1 Tax=Paenibacillus sp. FSL M7-0547 TaxID=2954755 RepID=UPI0030FADB20
MTENVGDLVVRIGMEDTTFKAGMQNLNRQMQLAQSSLRAASAEAGGMANSTDQLRLKASSLTDQIGIQEEKINALTQAHAQSAAANGEDAAATQRLQIQLNNARAALGRMRTDLQNTNDQIEDQTNKWKVNGRALQEVGEKMKVVGDKMQSVGKGLTVGVTAPLVGIGVAAAKVAIDVDKASNRIQAALGVTKTESKALAVSAQAIWKDGYGESLSEVNEALITTSKNIQGLNKNELKELTNSALILRDTFDAEVNETTRTASVLMKNFGIDGEEAMDLITVGFQRGGDFSGELLDTLREYAPQFKGMGYSAQEFTALLIAGAEKGAFNLDKIGDSAKESFIRIGDGSKSSRDAMSALGLNFKKVENDINSGGEGAQRAFGAVVTAIASVKDPAKQAQTAVALMGTPLEDLGPQFRDFFATANTDLGDFEGATRKAGEALQDNLGNRANKVWREAQAALVPIGEILVGIAEDYLPVIASKVQEASNFISNLSPAALKAGIAIGAIAAAAGPVIVGIGMLISTIGSVVSAIGTISVAIGGAGGLGAALTAVATGPIGIAVAAIAGLTMVGIGLYKHFKQDSIPEIQRFGSEVSASTQKAVGGFLDLNDKATVALDQLRWSGQTISKDMATDIKETFSQMGDQVTAAMKEDHAAQLQTMTEFFAGSKALTDQEESAAIEKMKANQTAQQGYVEEAQRKIAEIMDRSAQEKRGITEWERSEIDRLQQQMVSTGIKHLSENELEQKAIMERMRQNAGDLSARQAAEVVQNTVKQRDESIAVADEQYNEVIKTIIQQRDEAGTISAEQADKLIAEAKRQHDKTLEEANAMYNNVIDVAKKQAGEHVDQVDWETGEILSKWDIFKSDTAKKWEEIKEDTKRIWDAIWKAIKQIGVDINEDVQRQWNELIQFFKDIDLTQIGADIMNGLKKGIQSKADELGQTAKDISSKVGESIRDFFDIHSPSRLTTGYGEYIVQGLSKGMDNEKDKAAKTAKKTAAAVNTAFKESLADAQHKFKIGTLDATGYISALKKIQSQYAKTNDERRKITEEISKQNKALATEQIKKAKEAFDASKAYIDARVSIGKASLAQELVLWQQVQAKYKAGSVQRIAADKEVYRVQQEIAKAGFEASKSWIDKSKQAKELSLVQELAAWERVQAKYKEGTEQRTAADEAAGQVRLEIYTQLTAASEEFLAKTKEINANVAAEEKRLNAEYEAAVEQRAKSINDFAGLFDQVTLASETSGQDLLNNLRGQVEYLDKWADNIRTLSAKGIDKGLLEELRQMGPQAAPELAALNQLTDEQLQEYSGLWKTKASAARTAAVTELTGLRQDTNVQIGQLHMDAVTEMDKLRIDFEAKVKAIRGDSTKQFNAMKADLPTIGKQAMQGLIDGMSGMQGAVTAKAKEIADSVTKTMQKALDIHSPSRELAWIGGMAGAGLVEGLAGTMASIQRQAEAMAEAAMPGIQSPSIGGAYSGGGSAAAPAAAMTQIIMRGLFEGSVFNAKDENEAVKLGQLIGTQITDAFRSAGV